MNKKLEVKNLRVSFRTANGKVQAVRDISFDLYENETLAIVGESGSGKSVTTRAIMGISAFNAVLEGGEILYEGSDLLKYTEEDFQQLRGNKIAMIFQDPMSSLNPIVKVGKQLTEAMLLKNRIERKGAAKAFDRLLKKLTEFAGEERSEFLRLSGDFRRASAAGTRLEAKHTQARKNAEEAKERIGELLVAFDKKDEKLVRSKCAGIARYAKRCHDKYLPPFEKEEYAQALEGLKVPAGRETALRTLERLLGEALSLPLPDFFAIGYFETFAKEDAGNETDSANAKARGYCAAFEKEFLSLTQRCIRRATEQTLQKREEAIPRIREAEKDAAFFADKQSAKRRAAALAAEVRACRNPVAIRADSRETTFPLSIVACVTEYFAAAAKNEKERKRFARQNGKREARLAAGKRVDWKVPPAAITDLTLLEQKARAAMRELLASYDEQKAAGEVGADALVRYLKEQASRTAAHVTHMSAKRRAIRLLNEVGIPDPEKRYDQYPFQLSGGQRQRIVIAIALSADPDILICDEPTTALDVTIQAQILDLIKKIKRERKLSVIFITHDLGVVANVADRIAVMYAGKIVEYGTSEEVFYSPAHPYTWALLSSVPDLESSGRLDAIPGTPPNMIYPPEGDAFAERNRLALEIDFKAQPPMFRITDTHYAATWLLHPLAPKVEMPAAVTERIRRMKKEADHEQ